MPVQVALSAAARWGIALRALPGTVSDIVEYETAAMLGSNLEISDVKAVTNLAHLCDTLGLDSMTAGGAIGFAMEAAEKNLLPQQRVCGHEIKFGSVEAAEGLLRAIALREDGPVILLAGCVRRAAEKLGVQAEQFAVHIKGLETPAWGPRGATGIALSLMTADRGGCHQRGMPLGEDLGGVPGRAVRWTGWPSPARRRLLSIIRITLPRWIPLSSVTSELLASAPPLI